MHIHDLRERAARLSLLDLRTGPTYEEAMASAAALGTFHGCDLGIARFTGQPPWERHPADELIQVLDGTVELTLRTAAGPETHTLGPGALLIVPAGVWHRSNAADGVTVLFATPREGSERSLADDPLRPGE